jgi:hypothetical protein
MNVYQSFLGIMTVIFSQLKKKSLLLFADYKIITCFVSVGMIYDGSAVVNANAKILNTEHINICVML